MSEERKRGRHAKDLTNISPDVRLFLDMEAEIDNDGTDESDLEGSPRDFIGDDHDMQDTNLLPASARTTTDDQVLNVKEHELLLRQAWAIKQRCVTRNRSVSHSDWAEQGSDYEWSAFYDSTIDDIGIWRIRVKSGYELVCLEKLLQSSQKINKTWSIASALWNPSIPGSLYVEAPSPADVQRAFQDIYGVNVSYGVHLLPCSERARLFNLPRPTITKGSWVRIKQGTYKQCLGYVVDLEAGMSRVRVWVVPRISYEKLERSRPRRKRATRPTPHPSPSLFNPCRARTIFGEDSVESGAGFLKFQGMKFRDGLLEKVLPLNAVTSKDVRPTFEDITLFGESPGFDKAVIREWKIDEAVAALRVHDRVEVIEGELKGLIGAVVDINGQDNTVQVLPHSTTNALLEEDPRPLSIAAYHIRKAFEIGDYIQVRHGAYAGKRGHIVDVQLETETLEFVEFDNTATATGSILVHEDHLLNFQSSKAIIGDHVQIRRGVHVGKMGRILRIFEASGLVQIAVHYDSESNLDASASSYHVQMFNVNFVRNDQAASLADPAATAVTTNLSDPEVTDGLCQGVPVVNQATVSKKVRDPMAGRQVLVVGKSLYSGYYGTIQYTHEHLKHYSVCLEATGRVVQIGEGFIVDRQSRMPLNYFCPLTDSKTPVLPLPQTAGLVACVPSTPMPDVLQGLGGTPAWDPSSRTPGPDGRGPGQSPRVLENTEEDAPPAMDSNIPPVLPQASGLPARILPTPTIVYQQLAPCPFGDGPGSGPYGAYFLEPKRPDTDMPSNWLDTDKFDGVSIKVRVSGSTRESWPWENGSYEKQLACTLGKRPGGIPREIQIRLMSKGARILIAPIRFLIPVHPDGIKERGIIIVGDDMGKEVVVVEAGGPPWQVQTTAGKMLKVLREHIVVKSKLRLPS